MFQFNVFNLNLNLAGCYVNDHNAVGGAISSPNFPQPVSARKYCEWVLKPPRNRRMRLEFTNFNLKYDPVLGVCGDDLYIKVGSAREFRAYSIICGPSLPEPFETMSDHGLLIGFSSNGLAFNEGFRATYSSNEEMSN